MNTWAKRLKLWNWIASAALLFAAIAPALSQAVVSPNPSMGDMAMVCTSTGMKSVASLDAGSEAPANAANPACAFCVWPAHPPGSRMGTSDLGPARVASRQPAPAVRAVVAWTGPRPALPALTL